MLIHSQSSAQPTAKRAPTKLASRDASLELFRELYKYKGRIVVSTNSSPSSPATEAVFLCEILCLQFLSQRADAHIPPDTLKTFSRESLKLQLHQWFPTYANDAVEIDSRLLYELSQVFSKYTWGLGADSIQAWLLGYVYERWINQRETGSYFTPDLLAYNIAQLAIHEWLETQAENELGNAMPVRNALHDGKNVTVRVCEWLRGKLDVVRIVDLSMGGGAFLVAAARVLFELREKFFANEFERSGSLQHIFENNVFGMDISEQARRVAQMRLGLLALELNAFTDSFCAVPLGHLVIGDALAPLEPPAQFTQLRLLKEQVASFPDSFANLDFDLCVGNPPFIALSQKSAVSNKAQLVKQWNERQIDYAVTPTIDLSNFFILRGVERLNPSGVLAYITSRNFFDTRYGDPIRRYLTEQVDLRNVITLHDHPFTQLGVKVKANTVILLLIKRASQQAAQFQHLTFWDEPPARSNTMPISHHALQTSKNWTNILFDHPLRAELRARMTHTLGEYARVKMGVKSGCNSFFLLRTDSDAHHSLASVRHALVHATKNTREIRGFLVPQETAYRFLNLYEPLRNLEQGFGRNPIRNPLAAYIYQHGLVYRCAECQCRAEQQHKTHPERFPHRGMCQDCQTCQRSGACDRPADRLSTLGHLPAWYTLSLGEPPLIAVQCIVDTEIGVFLNRERVYLTDQFQVIEAPRNPEIGKLLFLYLQSRVSHFLLEGMGLHRARYDGSFMLKIQVEHLRELGCPAFENFSVKQKKILQRLLEEFSAVTNRKSDAVQSLRDELDNVFLEVLGYAREERAEIQPTLRAALDQAIRFRWVKTRTRLAELEKNGNGN